MKSIQNSAAIFFIIATAILSVISALGVWEFFSDDVITKSFLTLGLLAIVAIIIMVSGRFIESRSSNGSVIEYLPNPVFESIRHVTLTILIISVSLLALLGVMSIWEVIQNEEVLYKSLSSLAILAFGAFVMVMTCLDREGKLQKKVGGSSIGIVVLITFIVVWFISKLLSF